MRMESTFRGYSTVPKLRRSSKFCEMFSASDLHRVLVLLRVTSLRDLVTEQGRNYSFL